MQLLKILAIIVFLKLNTITGYHEYLIVLTPPTEVAERIKNLKEGSAKLIGNFESRYSKAHITVQNWPRKKPILIDPIIQRLKQELSVVPPITFKTNGFSSFYHKTSVTIYTKLILTPFADKWFNALKKSLKIKNIDPHITIAKTISNEAYQLLWPNFHLTDWKQSFVINKLTILGREMISHDRTWEKIAEIPFGGEDNFESGMCPVATNPISPTYRVYNQQISLF